MIYIWIHAWIHAFKSGYWIVATTWQPCLAERSELHEGSSSCRWPMASTYRAAAAMTHSHRICLSSERIMGEIWKKNMKALHGHKEAERHPQSPPYVHCTRLTSWLKFLPLSVPSMCLPASLLHTLSQINNQNSLCEVSIALYWFLQLPGVTISLWRQRVELDINPNNWVKSSF